MPKASPSVKNTSPGAALAHDLVDRIEEVLRTASSESQPIEIDPHRSRLFELFVMAEATGFLQEGSDPDLSCDGVAHDLAARWKLAQDLPRGISQPLSLPPQQLGRLRLLWSFMRMWMEWTYAWQRWDEFHQASVPAKAGQ
jgi:hypothetical protein